MKIWIDAQLSPAIALWINQKFEIDAIAVRDLNLRDAEDEEIFLAAKKSKRRRDDKGQRFFASLG